MKFDTSIAPESLTQMPALAESAERVGFDAIWTSETQHNPFLPLAIAAEHSDTIGLGTAIAVAFARSPGTVAYTAWDLAAASGGRFMLGLGTQVRAHIERRFGLDWPEPPAEGLREFVGAVRALWASWQHGEKLAYRGDRYKLTLMTPFFNPGPIDHPEIPIFLAGVNPGMCRLAGEIADGLHAHPLHSVRYLQKVVQPAVADGAAAAGREPGEVQLSVTAFVVTDEREADLVRSQIAFYASTPTYRRVLALHGWGDVAERLSALVRRGEWETMAAEISDPILETFAVVASEAELGAALRARYDGLADRLTIYRPFRADADLASWRSLAEALRA
ncbi:MAG: TIGR03617 family F420-dependent LLM class oxidoreductase [Anaerolineales bacterium]